MNAHSIGTVRFDDVYVRLHAASKAVVLGVVAVLVASLATRDGTTIARALLVAAFLLFTTPVATHAIGRAQWLRDHRNHDDEVQPR
jgi:multicomponent Na+:H+ antiporter subunit G